MKHPYNVKANFRMATAYRDINRLDNARKYIKRIVIWKSTDSAAKNLYKELVTSDQITQEKKDVIFTFIIEINAKKRIYQSI